MRMFAWMTPGDVLVCDLEQLEEAKSLDRWMIMPVLDALTRWLGRTSICPTVAALPGRLT
jgi:hypothetical protein